MTGSAYPSRPVVAIGAVVVHEGAVLLVRRGAPPNLGLWAVPGGRIELGESLREAAEREVLEETGVRVSARDPIYAFDAIEHDAEHRVRFHYVVVDLLADYVGGEPRAADDADEARWVTADELDSLAVSDRTLDLLRNTLRFGR